MNNNIKLLHVCEKCGKQAVLTPDEAFDDGWDYPPRAGEFGMISPRTCGECDVEHTVWWELSIEGKTIEQLSTDQKNVVKRILLEPGSLLVK